MKKYILLLTLLSFNVFAEDFRDVVTLPSCDASNPTVVIIDSESGFSQINDPNKRVFCIKSGNYDAQLKMTLSGTETQPRYIRHFNPEKHPVHMDESEMVVVKALYFLGSSHWVIDSITVRAPDSYSPVRMQPRLPYYPHWSDDANHIILNKLLVENSGGSSGQIAMGGYNLTVQDSVIRNSYVTPNKDDHGVVFYGNNNKLVGNEIYNNAGNDVQTSIGGNFGSAVIAYNEFYVTSDRSTDGQGNFDSLGLGEFLCQETAIGFKGGGIENNPLIFKGNKVWGFDRDDDPTCATGGGGFFPLSVSFNAHYIIFEDNIIYNNTWGVIFTNPTSSNITFKNNLFYNLNYAISAPPNKTSDNKYLDNMFYDVGDFFLDVGDDSIISGNHVLDKQVCFTKHQITNPIEICIGKNVSNSKSENIGNSILKLLQIIEENKEWQ